MFLISNNVNSISNVQAYAAFKANPLKNEAPKDSFESSNKPLQCEKLRSKKEVKKTIRKELKDNFLKPYGYALLGDYIRDKNYRKMAKQLVGVTYINNQGKPQSISGGCQFLYKYSKFSPVSKTQTIDIDKCCQDLQKICNVKAKFNGVEFSLLGARAIEIEKEIEEKGIDIDTYVKKAQAVAKLFDIKDMEDNKSKNPKTKTLFLNTMAYYVSELAQLIISEASDENPTKGPDGKLWNVDKYCSDIKKYLNLGREEDEKCNSILAYLSLCDLVLKQDSDKLYEDIKKLFELKEEDNNGNIKQKFSTSDISALIYNKVNSGQSWDWFLKTPEEQNEIIEKISKLNPKVPTEKICDFLNGKSSLPNDLISDFEKINEILYGKKLKELQEISDDFKKKTGINLHFDNNLDPKKVKTLLPTIEKFANTNNEKGYHNPNNIHITNMLSNDFAGFFDEHYDGFEIRPYYDATTQFYNTLHHENAHYMHWSKLKYPTNIEGDHIPEEYMEYVKKSGLREYAQTNTDEFVACVFEAVESNKNKLDKIETLLDSNFYVTKNKKGETVLREYIYDKTSSKKLKQEQKALEKIVELYAKLKGPKITPVEEPSIKGKHYVEAKLYD